MARGATLVVLSAVGSITGCGAAMQAQPPSCPPGQIAERVDQTLGRAEAQGPGTSAVQQANASDTAANRLNGRIVGVDRQRRNEETAMTPRTQYRCVAESRGANRGAGVTSMQGGVGQTAAPATGGFERTVRDVTEATNPPGPYRPFAIEINPLGLFVGGRLSLNAEWAPATHHAIVLSPHFVHTTASVPLGGGTMGSQAYTGVGTEIGYRYYTGSRGMNGVFVGPSLIMGVYNAGLPMGNQAFTNVGVAGDVGLQEILWNRIVVGGGVGIEYLQVSHDFGDLPIGPSTIASTGFKPRFLLEAGYGF
jgi:hypothetical protein